MRLVNEYTISPKDIQPGDVMMVVVKAIVVAPQTYRIYRCTIRGDEVPQGMRILDEEEVCKTMFPSLANVAHPDEF